MRPEPLSRREAIRLTLERAIGTARYAELRGHLDRDALFVVDASVALIDCALAVAMDDVDDVQSWIARQSLRKPSRLERADWPLRAERRWLWVVVEPFALVQEIVVATEIVEA